MRSRPFRQFVVVATLFVSVGAIGSAVTFSRSHAVDRLQRAIYQDETPTDSPSAESVPQSIKAPKASPDATERPRGGLNSRDIESLDKQLRSFKVRLSPEGTVKGRMSLYDPEKGSMSVLNDLRIVFLQNGEVIAETTPDTAGTFTASLEPGVYALVAAGPQGYAAYGIQVVKPDVLKSVSYQEVQDDIAIDSLAIPPRDFETATRLARTYIPKDILKNGAKSPEAAVTEPLPATENEAPSVGGSDPDTALRNHSVVIQADGSLMGRMRRLHPQTGQPLKIRRLNVFLVQENSILAQATVSEAGMFKFRNVPSGMYSFVASGTDGLAAFAFQAVNQSVAQADTPNELTLVSFAADGGMGTSGSTTGSENAQQATQQLVGAGGAGGNGGAGAAGAGAGGGGAGGQGGGQGGQGGAGGGAGGGLGGIAAAAGAAGIAAAAAQQNTDPVSPPGP